MLYTTQEVARELKVCDATVRRMIKDGRIAPEYVSKIGNDWRLGKLDPRKRTPKWRPAETRQKPFSVL